MMTTGFSYLPELSSRLASRLPRIGLGQLPTPVSAHDLLGHEVWIKHDEHTDAVLGGNKLRKLRYLLAPAKAQGARTVATFGALGSNHAIATAFATRRLGLKPMAYLSRQAPTQQVQIAVAWHQSLGTKILYWGGGPVRQRRIVIDTQRERRQRVWAIPLGGSSWRGSVGFIEAAAELANQVANGACPAPERIYIPMGTLGSAVGLAVGLAVARLPTKVMAVQVVGDSPQLAGRIQRFGDGLIKFCQCFDHSFQAPTWRQHLQLRNDYLAGGYARADQPTEDAQVMAANEWQLELETTYSAKALAALLGDLNHNPPSGPVMFWNTYSGAVSPPASSRRGPLLLPPELEPLVDGSRVVST